MIKLGQQGQFYSITIFPAFTDYFRS